MPSVYLTSIYSLFDLANTQRGHVSCIQTAKAYRSNRLQRVLIHSASGGVGIACIQLCQYIGAQVGKTKGAHRLYSLC